MFAIRFSSVSPPTVKVEVSNTCSVPSMIAFSTSATFSAVPSATVFSFRAVIRTAPSDRPLHPSTSVSYTHLELTRRWNTCLVVTDGTAVLGLGDIGPEAGMPVMERCV